MTRVFLLGGRGGGGEEVFVRDLAASPPQGVTYALAMDAHESIPGARALRGREVLFNRLLHPFLWPLLGLRAYEVAPEIALIHVHNYPTWMRRPRHCPVVYSVGGSSYAHYLETYLGWPTPRVRARYRRARRLYRPLGILSELATPERVDAVVVFSGFAADYMARFGVPRAKVHVVPPGFDVPAPAPRPSRHGTFTFLLVGREPLRKGADLAVEATRRLRGQGADVCLRLVGDDAYAGWSEDGVDGHGPVPRDVLFRDFFGRCDAVLVPSRAEGFGFAAVEAMGMGLPVLVARRDALPDIVGDAGLVVEPDVAELTRAMAELAADRRAALDLGAAGRARFEARFSREKAREALGAVYAGVLAG